VHHAPVFALSLGQNDLRADVDAGKRMQNSENVEKPQDCGDYYHSIQNGLYGALHGDEVIHQPEQNSHYHQHD
jgi:hypothetical protein